MYSSQALPNTLNHSFPTAYKPAKEDLQESRGAMASGYQHQQQQQQQMNSGLMRFSSAPGSLLKNFIDGGEGGDNFLSRSSSLEAETMMARFKFPRDSTSPDIRKIDEKGMGSQRSPQFTAANESEMKIDVPQPNRSSSAWPMHIQMEQRQNHCPQNGAAIGTSFGLLNSMAMNSQQMKSGSNCSNLTRHSSSPAGLFSKLTVDNGYVAMRGMGNVRAGTDGEAASTSSLSNHTNFLSKQTSNPGLLSKISEMGAENIASRIAEDGSLESTNGGSTCSVPGYHISSWDDLPLGEDSTGLKRPRDINGKMTSGLNRADTLNEEPGTGLLHQLSFPKTALEMDAMEKILQFQGSVPCKIRAKRGCATHPRSIAERVRRTRISERMRKLQELVPNMDKQTNTSDMLDLAVEYIKELQRQVKTLKDNRGSCTCSSKQKPNPSSAV